MTLREFQILGALNIASARHRHPQRGYEATAAHIAEVGVSDPRFGYEWMTAAAVGNHLRQMAKDWPTRPAPLVERSTTRHWRLTAAGLDALAA